MREKHSREDLEAGEYEAVLMRELKTPQHKKNPACKGESEQRGKKWNQKIR